MWHNVGMFINNFNHKEIYFWSDLHLRHDRDFIYEPRGHKKVNDHDAASLQEIASLPSKSTLFLLGDTIFGVDSYSYWLQFLSWIPCEDVYIMPGNHYSGLKELKRTYGRTFTLPKLGEGPISVHLIENYYELDVNGQFIVLCHYPIISWNKMGRGAWHLFGHVHGRVSQGRIDGQGFGKMLDVGVESVKKPVSITDLELIMSKKQASHIDHHAI